MGVDEVSLSLADDETVANLADYQMQRKTKVVLCDGQALMLVGVREVLEQAEGFEVVGEARLGSEVLPLIDRTHPDVVLLDMRMPGIDGLGCLDRIRVRHPKVKVVVFSVSTNTEHIQAALARGASGYIVKNINPRDLPSALRQAVARESLRLEGGLTLLATVGSSAPFIGLLGTVWGIYHALIKISASGNASMEAVAGPVGEALIMTAFGLFTAIPAVLAYNFFNRSNRLTYAQFDEFAHDLHDFFATGARVEGK